MFKLLSENMNTYSADSNAMASFSCENSENETSLLFAHAMMACAFLFNLTAISGSISAVIISVIIISVILSIIAVIIKTNRICALKDTGC